jgi:hypothetical protein
MWCLSPSLIGFRNFSAYLVSCNLILVRFHVISCLSCLGLIDFIRSLGLYFPSNLPFVFSAPPPTSSSVTPIACMLECLLLYHSHGISYQYLYPMCNSICIFNVALSSNLHIFCPAVSNKQLFSLSKIFISYVAFPFLEFPVALFLYLSHASWLLP